jgi:hypothetical protein
MLSEVWRLWQALERSNLNPPRKHRRVYTPGRTSPCLRVRLGKGGTVCSVESVGDSDWPAWTVMEGNQNSFPVVRVSDPLLDLPRDHEIWKKLGFTEKGKRRKPPPNEQRLTILAEIVRLLGGDAVPSKSSDLWNRLREQKARELLCIARKGGPDLRAAGSLALRFRRAAASPTGLLKDVAERSVARLKQGQLDDLDAVEQLLVGKGPRRPDGKRPSTTVQLAFDIESADKYPAGVYSERAIRALISHLPQDSPQATKKGAPTVQEHRGVDSFTGELADLETKTFPSVEIPVPSLRPRARPIGRKKFPLSSMFSEARCNERYGMTDAQVFPIARTRATRLKEALEYITSDDRRERTWQHVSSGRFETRNGRKIEKPDLLVAYVEERPVLDAKTAGYFGQGPAQTEAKFEVDAATVCEALQGVARERPRSRLNLFLIRETSKGQAQVVLSESPTVEDVLSGAACWQGAVKENLPALTLPIPPLERGQKLSREGPLVPYPDQVVRLLSFQWVRDGSSPKSSSGRRQEPKQAVVGPTLSEVLSLMLRVEGKWEPSAYRLLSILLQRLTPLLIGVFGAARAFGPRQDGQRQEPLFDYPRDARQTALRGVAVLGILLDALNCRKEVYMENAPYQVGQVMALADTIHKDYCVVVRKGSLPNSLIGTGLMRRALDNPAAALAELAERMLEYLRWAKTVEVPQGAAESDPRRIAVLEAKKRLRQCQPLAAKLGNAALPIECTDVMKAQLLLGFLASPPEGGENQNGHDEKDGDK